MTITGPTHLPGGTDFPVQPTRVDAEDPSEGGISGTRAGANLYGAFSMEQFCDVGGLSLTHDDAAGFLAYVEQFNARNFWYQDSGVKSWAYGETYDNWQNTYGMDAVRAPYHSGHGGMDGNGVFYVPMGAAWAGNDCTVTSQNMRLGNETARYVFWSTCLSLRVLDGHTPIRTWSTANLGLRMIFGFETVSWDDANYGSNFWRHWRNNESFSSAWLNGSWDIAHDQAPSVCACGSTPDEARDRVFNERYFYPQPASTAWWHWRWYNVAASLAREPRRSVPADPRIALLAPTSATSLRAIADRFDVDPTTAIARNGVTSMSDGRRYVSMGDDGLITIHITPSSGVNHSPISRREATSVAGGAVRQFGLDADSALVLDRVVEVREAGASMEGDTHLDGPHTTETLVQYRQLINGLPVITPNHGVVRVFVDGYGAVRSIQTRTRAIEELTEKARLNPGEPPPPEGPERDARPVEARDPEAALGRAFSAQMRLRAIEGSVPLAYSVVPGTTEVGYDIQGDAAVLVAQRAIEYEFEDGYRKRYWLKAPLFA